MFASSSAGDADLVGEVPIIARLDGELLAGAPTLTLPELAAAGGVSPDDVRAFWMSLGLPVDQLPDNKALFTELDVAALRCSVDLVTERGLSVFTAQSLVRALGQTCDRLSLWQVEALVEDAAARYELDDVSARLVVLDQLGSLVPLLERQLIHAWRRQMAAIASRYAVEFGGAAPGAEPAGALPLLRSLGFADMVEYTSRTAGLGSHELAELVHRFETTVRTVVISAGGRVVKTIGDAVMFVSDLPATGALIALGLAEAMAADSQLPEVRVSVCYGRILSRFGDIFGPPANIAARLNEVAGPGQVLTDAVMAQVLAGDARFQLEALAPRKMVGVGEVTPVVLTRAAG